MRKKVSVGIDEAGRGPLCGPVVAAAVCFRESEERLATLPEWTFIRDSKKLSEKQREKMFGFIMEHCFVGVGIMQADTVDRVNILEATFLAMKAALSELKRVTADELRLEEENTQVLVDGNQLIPNIPYEQQAIVDGDALVKSIAAASIIAKTTRDALMDALDVQYPQYGFKEHRGYATLAHREAIRKFGTSVNHRLTFRLTEG